MTDKWLCAPHCVIGKRPYAPRHRLCRAQAQAVAGHQCPVREQHMRRACAPAVWAKPKGCSQTPWKDAARTVGEAVGVVFDSGVAHFAQDTKPGRGPVWVCFSGGVTAAAMWVPLGGEVAFAFCRFFKKLRQQHCGWTWQHSGTLRLTFRKKGMCSGAAHTCTYRELGDYLPQRAEQARWVAYARTYATSSDGLGRNVPGALRPEGTSALRRKKGLPLLFTYSAPRQWIDRS